MLKKTVQLLLILTLAVSALVVINQNTSLAAISDPVSLKIYAYPPNILADNNTYNCIYVQLIDSSGKPARALENTTISLSSFDINIGTVDPTVTILSNTTYATANFTATYSPGTTQITASANGFSTVKTSLNTIAPFPSAVAVYGVPSTLPADGGTYDAIMVQLQDSDGTPAMAPRGGVFVALSSSNTTVGTVTPNVTIAEGSTYAIANFTAQLAGGTTTITSVPEMYASGTVQITTTPLVSDLAQLKLYVGPDQLLADRSSYRQIAVELQNASGCTAISPTNITVLLSSSDPTIGKVVSQITLPANQAFVVTSFNTTYRAGTTTLTAVADNFERDQKTITTNGFTPAQLTVYCPPLMLPADNGTYPAVVVQLQDAQGRPAKDSEGNVTLKLFSSQPTVAMVNSTITIPFGETQAVGDLTVTNSPGSTTITAQASSYATGQASVTTYLIDFLPMQVTGNVASEVNYGQKTDVLAFVTSDNNTVSGASVFFTSDNGGTFSGTSDLGNGNYKATYTAPSFTQATNCTITATASKYGYITSQATMQITVSPPPPSPTPTATPSPSPMPTPTATPTANPNQNTNPTQSAENTTGSIQLCIQDLKGNPLSNASVTSITHPNGTTLLSGVTNSSGYVVFRNASVGQYVFKILKAGYDSQNKAVLLNGDAVNRTYSLDSQAVASGGGADLTLPIIVVVVVVVAVVVGVVLYKRRGSDDEEYEYEDES